MARMLCNISIAKGLTMNGQIVKIKMYATNAMETMEVENATKK